MLVQTEHSPSRLLNNAVLLWLHVSYLHQLGQACPARGFPVGWEAELLPE